MFTSTVSEVPVEFSIDPASRLPICRQLASQIREAVARGKLQPEQRLPSVRELSRSLVVNPNTIARVYTELEREGVLNTRPGLGVFVASPAATCRARSASRGSGKPGHVSDRGRPSGLHGRRGRGVGYRNR